MNVKTPISILHELMARRNIVPQYDLLQDSEGIGTNAPSFHYQVIADNVRAVGIARSKKEAKHAAARLALDELAKRGMYIPNFQATTSPNVTPTSASPINTQVNLVGCLQEFCSEKSIPQPEFTLTADIGPAHLRNFTMECKVGTITVNATELTKKKAKQAAAQKMLHRLVDSLPDVVDQNIAFNDIPALPDTDEIIKCYKEVSILNKKKTNWGMKLADYPKAIKNIMTELNITYEDLWKDVDNTDIRSLQHILKCLELEYTLEYRNSKENIYAFVTLNSDPDFAFLGTGQAETSALISALGNIFEFLKIMTK